MLALVLTVVIVALIFEYINGFHDTANSIATVVATKVLSPMQAVGLAASMNLVGALAWGVGITLTGYYAAAIPGVKSAAYIIAGFFITASIVFGLRTWLAYRANNRLEVGTGTGPPNTLGG